MHSARCRRPTQPPLKFTRRAAWIHAASGSTVGTPAASEAIDFSSRLHLHTSSVSGWAGGGPVSFEPTRSCGAHRTCSMPATSRPNPSSAFPSRGIFLLKGGRLEKRTGVPQREERVVRERALQAVRRREVPAREAKQNRMLRRRPWSGERKRGEMREPGAADRGSGALLVGRRRVVRAARAQLRGAAAQTAALHEGPAAPPVVPALAARPLRHTVPG